MIESIVHIIATTQRSRELKIARIYWQFVEYGRRSLQYSIFGPEAHVGELIPSSRDEEYGLVQLHVLEKLTLSMDLSVISAIQSTGPNINAENRVHEIGQGLMR